MAHIEPVIPQEGKPGMTVDDLIFHKHEMAQTAAYVEEALKEMMPESAQDFMNLWTESVKSTKHAVVAFPNGATLSVITGTPSHEVGSIARSLAFARGDERVPTYEVSIFIPGREADDIRSYLTPGEVNAILAELSS